MNKKTWKFHIPWPLCLLAMVFALPFNIYAAFEGQQGPFTMIIMGDPQMPWWPDMDMPAGCNFQRASDSDLPSPKDTKNTPNDLTDDTCDKDLGDSRAETVKDSSGNVIACKWTWHPREDGPQHCASKIENQDRVNAIRDVTNANGGVWPSHSNSNGGDSIKKPEAIIINGDLTAYFHDWQLYDYAEYYQRQLGEESGYLVLAGLGNHDYQNNFDNCTNNSCYRNGVEFAHQMTVAQRVSNFPAYWVQSYDPGSLSYSWTYGNYVFLQLHNYPNYEKDDEQWPIVNSRDWMRNQIDNATAAGKYIVLNWHDYDGNNTVSDIPDDIKSIIENTNVVAVFVAHSTSSGALGYQSRVDQIGSSSDMINAFGNSIPYFKSGHSGEPDIHHKFLLVEFDVDRFTVASMDASGGNASFHNKSSSTHLNTYVINRAATPPEPYGFVAIGVPDEDVMSDIQIPGPFTNTLENDAGAVNVFYKTLSGDSFGQQWTQNNLGPTAVEDNDKHGSSLAVGDFNGDGYPDLASGAPLEDFAEGNDSGAVSIVYGTDTGLHGELQRLDQGAYNNIEANDQFGFALATGDFNGDGYDDLAASAPYEDVNNCSETNGVDAGAVKIFYGSSSGLLDSSDQHIDQADVGKDTGWDCRKNNFMGFSLAAGNFDNDPYDDLAVGVPGKDVNSENDVDGGGVLVFFGGSNGIDRNALRWKGITQNNKEAGDQFGFALAAGDFNGDGHDDLAISAPYENTDCAADDGNVNVYNGTASGLSDDNIGLNQGQIDSSRGWPCDANDHFGFALAAGDFNGDGFAELAVGIPDDDRDANNVGGVLVYSGRSGGLSSDEFQGFLQSKIDPCARGCDSDAGSQFGFALAAGDANLDGFDDLAVGAAYEDTDDGNQSGVVHVFWGSSSRLNYNDVTTLDQKSSVLIADGREANDHFGFALAVSPNPNTTPIADAGLDQTVKEGTPVTLNGSFIDPDAGDIHSFQWTITSTSIAGTAACDPAYSNTVLSTNLAAQFTPLQDCTYSLTFKVTDYVGATGSDTVQVTVVNANPAINSLTIDAINEGDTATLTIVFSDPGVHDNFTGEIDWGDGEKTPLARSASDPKTFDIQHQYLDNPDTADYTVTVTLADSDGGSTGGITKVQVRNVDPQIDALNLSATPINENGFTELTVEFSDVGILDTHDIVIDWGDGNPKETFTGVNSPFNASHQYLDDPKRPDDTYLIQVRVIDDDAGSQLDTIGVTVNNLNPQIDKLNLSLNTINENDKTQLMVEFSDVGTLDTHKVSIDWGDGSPVEIFNPVSSPFTPPAHRYLDDPSGTAANETYTIKVKVDDDDGGSDNDTIDVTVNNLDPVLSNLTLESSIQENGTVTLKGSISDIGNLDTFEVTVNWGDPLSPNNVHIFTLNSEGAFDLTHQYLDDNPSATQADDYTVTVEVIDDDGGSDSDSAVVTVNNVAPANLTLSAPAIDENGLTTLTGSFTDPGSLDTFTLDINWGDALSPDNAQTISLGTDRTFSISHQYLDDNPTATASDNYTIEVTVSDDDSGSVTGHTTVTVNNVNPVATVDALTDALSGLSIAYRLNDTDDIPGDLDVVLLGTLMELAGSYTDIGALDTHSATLDWNDGTDVEAVPLAESGVNDQGLAYGITDTVSHVYASDLAPGPYNLVLMVTDDDTGADAPVATIELVDAAGALEDALADLQALIDQDTLPPETELALQAALYKLSGDPLLAGEADGDGDGDGENGALDQLEKDNLSSALAKIEQAIEWLIEAEMLYEAETGLDELDLTVAKTQLTLTAKSITEKALNAAVPLADKANEQRKLEEAEEDRNEGDAALAEQDYLAALAAYRSAVQAVVTIK